MTEPELARRLALLGVKVKPACKPRAKRKPSARNREIGALHRTGVISMTAIALRYGVTRERIRQIVERLEQERQAA